MFAIGALSQVGQELIQPNSQTTVNSAFGSSVSTERNGTNIVGAVLAGGGEVIADRMEERNQERLDELRNEQPQWFLPEGAKLSIYISQDFYL